MSAIKSGLAAAAVLGFGYVLVAPATADPTVAGVNEAHHYHRMYHHHGRYKHRHGVSPQENNQTRSGGQPGGGAGGS